MNIYFILWVIIQYYFIYFVALVVPALAIRSSFSWFLCLFDLAPSIRYLFIFEHLSFCHYRDILYISCPTPRIRYFSNEPWFLLLENGIRDQDLGTRYARRYWVCSHLFY